MSYMPGHFDSGLIGSITTLFFYFFFVKSGQELGLLTSQVNSSVWILQ